MLSSILGTEFPGRHTCGKVAVTTVAGCMRRLAPTFPPTVTPLRSSSAGVCRAPPAAITCAQRSNSRLCCLFWLHGRVALCISAAGGDEAMTTPLTWRGRDVDAVVDMIMRSA